MGKQVITAAYINKEYEAGHTTLNLHAKDCIITPGARDKIEELGMVLAGSSQTNTDQSCDIGKPSSGKQEISSSSYSNVGGVTDQVFNLLRDQLPDENPTTLESLVRKTVEAKLLSNEAPESMIENGLLTVYGDVAIINGNRVFDEDAAEDMPGKVSISGAIRCHAKAPHSTTYMQWKRASFDRTIESSEINLVVEGELEITVDGKKMPAKAGDMIYVNKGAVVTYSTPTSVKLTCVNF